MRKTTLILASLAVIAAANAQDIGVNVNGRPVVFGGTPPKMVDNSVLVPLRGVFERMGAEVKWNQQNQEVTAIKGNKVIRLVIGQRFADVGGKAVQLAVPAQVQAGSTLVPLRFVSEALGARVKWNPDRMLVMVDTDPQGRAESFGGRGNGMGDRNDAPRRREAMATLSRATVIPVRLDTELSSNESRRGDTFTASLDATNGVYGQLPGGTKIEGRVVTAKRQDGNEPGLLELSFDKLILPDGTTQDLSGTLVSMSDKDLKTDADGRIMATGKAKDNRGLYAGYGAGAGLLLGVLSGDNTKGNVTKSLLGGLLGLGAGEYQKNQKAKPSNVHLNQGEKFGVRLDEDLTIYRGN